MMSEPKPTPLHNLPPLGSPGDEFVLPRAPWQRAALYPDLYVWYVLFAALDIMLTWIVLHFEGEEVNPVALGILQRYGLAGMVAYKFMLVTLVILICETVGHARDRVGRKLAEWAVAITAIPVIIALTQLFQRMIIDGAAWDWEIKM